MYKGRKQHGHVHIEYIRLRLIGKTILGQNSMEFYFGISDFRISIMFQQTFIQQCPLYLEAIEPAASGLQGLGSSDLIRAEDPCFSL